MVRLPPSINSLYRKGYATDNIVLIPRKHRVIKNIFLEKNGWKLCTICIRFIKSVLLFKRREKSGFDIPGFGLIVVNGFRCL